MDASSMTRDQAEQLGRYVRAGRHAAGVGTHRLATAIGVNQSRLIRLEQGKVNQPEPALLQKLASALELPLTELYELAGIKLPELHTYLRSSSGLTEEGARKAVTYIQKLAADEARRANRPDDKLSEPFDTNE